MMPTENELSMKFFNIIKDLNLIVSYAYSDEALAGWVKTIIRLYPNATTNVIGRITDNFLTGKEDFDRSIGVLNYTKRINSYTGTFK